MRRLAVIAAVLLFATPAWAAELPTRKAGSWEIKMEFQGHSRLSDADDEAMHRCLVRQIDDL